MFSKRSDGRQIKGLDPFFKLIPHVMTRRSDAQIFYKQRIFTAPIDEYIKQKKEEGISVSYMTVVIAAFVRLLGQRPSMNRFIMNGRIFARNRIWVSFAIKKSLRDESQETTLKLGFDGTETLAEISQVINDAIALNKKASERNITDKLAEVFMNMPNLLIQFLVATLKQMDRWGMMPKSVVAASPFHTSFFITNVKSISLNYLYHHLYDFGTTSVFLALGNQDNTPVMTRNGLMSGKSVTIGVTVDERICDGLYLANSLKLFKRYMENPSLLDEPVEAIVPDID